MRNLRPRNLFAILCHTFLVFTQIGLMAALPGGGMPLQAAEAGKTNEATAGAAGKGYKDVDVEQFDKLRGDKKNIVLDVRSPEEFAAGHIPGAVNIDLHSPEFQKKVGALDKSKTYLVHCAVGGRSATACGKLSKQHFTNCYNLLGGMRAWQKAGKPVER